MVYRVKKRHLVEFEFFISKMRVDFLFGKNSTLRIIGDFRKRPCALLVKGIYFTSRTIEISEGISKI